MAAIDPLSIRTPRDLARLIDHTLLDPKAQSTDVERLCEEAKEHQFAGVCVYAEWLPEVVRHLAGTRIVPVVVVDFPKGEGPTAARALEARRAVEQGAGEIDVVLPVEPLKRKDYRYVLADLAEIVGQARVPVKVILETSRLEFQEKIVACALAKAAGAAFVKTSTGMAGGGATVEDVTLLRSVVGQEVGVKASGGIRSAADALRMVQAGANRLGTSASIYIVTGAF